MRAGSPSPLLPFVLLLSALSSRLLLTSEINYFHKVIVWLVEILTNNRAPANKYVPFCLRSSTNLAINFVRVII